LIGSQRADPSSGNSYIDEANQAAGTTKELSKISSAVFFYGEFVWLPGENFGVGLRYTVAAGGATGERLTEPTNVSIVMGDLSLVAKLQTAPTKFQAGLGVTLGTAAPMGVTADPGIGPDVAYSAESSPVARLFGTGRLNFGRSALFLELGVVSARATELKNGSTVLTHADGSNVELVMNGGYGGIGTAAQF
jgi:hypothetical protein